MRTRQENFSTTTKNSCPKYTTVGDKDPVLNWNKIISGN